MFLHYHLQCPVEITLEPQSLPASPLHSTSAAGPPPMVWQLEAHPTPKQPLKSSSPKPKCGDLSLVLLGEHLTGIYSSAPSLGEMKTHVSCSRSSNEQVEQRKNGARRANHAPCLVRTVHGLVVEDDLDGPSWFDVESLPVFGQR